MGNTIHFKGVKADLLRHFSSTHFGYYFYPMLFIFILLSQYLQLLS
ncbi:hypothetical protein L291_3140 [Acinetobacter guillouiae MSP4-18]|nr:hypothetical protein L291_3140 [Acinetobacter guillouiae MSP4-18]BAP37680.1 hypothetical protein AS4_27400 [Acinetobacter guillouiae]